MIRRSKRQRIQRRIVFVIILLLFSTGFLFYPVLNKRIEAKRTDSVPISLGQLESDLRDVPASSAEADLYLDLVNKTHPIPADYVPDDLTEVTAVAPGVTCTQLRKPVAEAFAQLTNAAAIDGYTLVLRSGYRSYETQQKLFAGYVKRDGQNAAEQYSAPPGCSEHQIGLAVDVTSPSVNYKLDHNFDSTAEGNWLAENAHRFGFIIRYPDGKQDITGYIYEPWHIRYVGNEPAAEIYQQNVTLEEYLENLDPV